MRDVLLIAARVVTAGHLVGAWSGVIRPAHPHAGFAIGQQRLPIPFPLNPVLLSQDMQEHGNRHRYPPNGGRAITRMPNPKRGRSRSPHARRSRELRRNAATRGGTLHYRAVVAQWKAEPADVSSKGQQARRQRPAARVCAGPAVRCVDRPGWALDPGAGGGSADATVGVRIAGGPRMESEADCQPAPDRLPR
jgi:hypothetical protein